MKKGRNPRAKTEEILVKIKPVPGCRVAGAAAMAADPVREKALADYRKKLMEHKEVGGHLYLT